eukprot:scaffold312651_cov17-Tisochrysis_lutea.AAC.1
MASLTKLNPCFSNSQYRASSRFRVALQASSRVGRPGQTSRLVVKVVCFGVSKAMYCIYIRLCAYEISGLRIWGIAEGGSCGLASKSSWQLMLIEVMES